MGAVRAPPLGSNLAAAAYPCVRCGRVVAGRRTRCSKAERVRARKALRLCVCVRGWGLCVSRPGGGRVQVGGGLCERVAVAPPTLAGRGVWWCPNRWRRRGGTAIGVYNLSRGTLPLLPPTKKKGELPVVGHAKHNPPCRQWRRWATHRQGAGPPVAGCCRPLDSSGRGGWGGGGGRTSDTYDEYALPEKKVGRVGHAQAEGTCPVTDRGRCDTPLSVIPLQNPFFCAGVAPCASTAAAGPPTAVHGEETSCRRHAWCQGLEHRRQLPSSIAGQTQYKGKGCDDEQHPGATL